MKGNLSTFLIRFYKSRLGYKVEITYLNSYIPTYPSKKSGSFSTNLNTLFQLSLVFFIVIDFVSAITVFFFFRKLIVNRSSLYLI